jgi:dimethylargininase
MMFRNSVIICSPATEYFRVTDTGKHNITSKSNPEKARSQHLMLKATLGEAGFKVYDIPELEDHPNSVFTRDASLLTPKGYINLQMGLETRRGEEEWMTRHLDSLGIRRAGSISGKGTVEGGDVILTGSIAFVGLSRRTNKEGLSQLSTILKAMNFDVRSIEVPDPFLHLGGAMSILSAEDVLCCQGIFQENFFDGLNRIEVPKDNFVTGNVISLGNHEVIAEKMNTPAIDILRQKGYIVHSLDLSEFIKGTGGPSCLILPG